MPTISSTLNRRSALRILAGGVLAALSPSISACSTATIGEEEPETPVGQIIPSQLAIVHMGALEGQFSRDEEEGRMGIAKVAQLAHDKAGEDYEVLTLCGGDALGGTLLVGLSDGEDAVGFLNAADLDALVLGPRELALGSDLLGKRISQSEFSYLCANATDAHTGEPLVDANKVFTLSDGRMVGVFGLTAPSAVAEPAYVHAPNITLSADLVACAQAQVDELRTAGCRLVVCLAYLGSDDELTAEQLASQVDGIDVLLVSSDASSSDDVAADASENETLLVQTSREMRATSVATWSHGALSASVIDAAAQEQVDEQVDALVVQTSLELEDYLSQQVSTSTAPLASDSDGLRRLAVDAMLWATSRSLASKAPDAALLPVDTLASSLPKGSVKRADALSTLPHDQTRLYTLQLTGEQLLKLLGDTGYGSKESLLQTAGITFPTPKATNAKGAESTATKTSEKDVSGTGITPSQVGKRAFVQADGYLVVTTATVAAADGAYAACAESSESLSRLGTSAGIALADYLASECKKGIPSTYLPAQPKRSSKPTKADSSQG